MLSTILLDRNACPKWYKKDFVGILKVVCCYQILMLSSVPVFALNTIVIQKLYLVNCSHDIMHFVQGNAAL